MIQRRDELELLEIELGLMEKARKMLEYSYAVCNQTGVQDKYTYEELDKFEALTSRFARTSDLLTQKIFRLIDIIELERPGSVIDRINRAEKRGIIPSRQVFQDIRRLRNDISHEYIPEIVEEIFKKVLKLTPYLLESIREVQAYCQKKILDQ